MIHELRVYDLKPGSVGTMLDASGTVARGIRGDNYGKLEGHFSSEIGPLNQYVHLWSFDSIEEMLRLRGELGAREDWKTDYLPLIRPIVLRQTVRILIPVLPMKPVETEGNLYELRRYRFKPGQAVPWAAKMAEHMPAREKYSTNLGVWTCQWPDPNEVLHLWVYESFEARMEARKASQADPDWQPVLAAGREVIEEMHSVLLMPSAYSPRK